MALAEQVLSWGRSDVRQMVVVLPRAPVAASEGQRDLDRISHRIQLSGKIRGW